MNWALDVDAGSGSAKLVLLILANRANEKGHCWPGIDGISEQSNLSRRAVIDNIKKLTKLGLVAIESRGGDGDGRKSNVYRLMLDGGQSADLAQCRSRTSNVQILHGQSAAPAPEPKENPHRTQKGGRKAPDWSSVPNLDQEVWAEWLADRRRRKLRAYTTTREATRLAKLPPDLQRECVDYSMDRYQGLFPQEFANAKTQSGRTESFTDKLKRTRQRAGLDEGTPGVDAIGRDVR